MKHLNAAIIGLGIGEKHIDAFNNHPECEITAVCDFDRTKLEKVSEKYPDVNVTQNADEILTDPDINVVSIASYDNFHADQVLKALQYDKHVFVEKPICLQPDEALAIRKTLKNKSGIHLSSNLNLRTCPRFIRLKQAVQSGEMGRLFFLEGDYLWGRIQKLTDGWRKDMAFYSVIYGAAVHMIDLILWVTNQQPVEVTGYGNRIATEQSDLRYNDFAVILLKFGDGMIAKISANGGCVHPHFHKIAVFGSKKTFLNDLSGGMFLTSRELGAERMEVAEEYPAVNEKSGIITSFINSILSTNPLSIVTADDVFSTMSVCFAAEEALKEGKTVKIKYIT